MAPGDTRNSSNLGFYIRRNIMGGQFQVYKDESGKYRWKLTHKSGLVLVDSGKGRNSKTRALIDLWNTLFAVNKR